jgi:hypothetical protein
MSRLYYDQSTPRLQTGKVDKEAALKNYLEKVSKIIPGEVIAVYLALIGFVPLIKQSDFHQGFYYFALALGTIGTPVYIWFQAETNKPKKIHIILSAISFMVWAYQTTGDKIFHTYDQAIASFILVAYSFVVGIIPLN